MPTLYASGILLAGDAAQMINPSHREGSNLAMAAGRMAGETVIAAKKKGMTVISLTGEGGGKLAAHSNILLAVPARETPVIQQVHICLYHYLCQEVERRMLD